MDVRDLVSHTSRSLVTVETYLAAEPGEVTVRAAAAYYEVVLRADPAAIAERGREAGQALGHDPFAFLADLDVRVQAAVAGAEDDAYVASAAGGMRLIDYRILVAPVRHRPVPLDRRPRIDPMPAHACAKIRRLAALRTPTGSATSSTTAPLSSGRGGALDRPPRRLTDATRPRARGSARCALSTPALTASWDVSSTLITVGGLVAAGVAIWAVGHFHLVDRGKELVGLS